MLALFPSPASQAAGPPWPTTEILHVAHRGGGAEAPENTLAAFQNAIDFGADFIECDLHRTFDNVLTLFVVDPQPVVSALVTVPVVQEDPG